MLLRMVVSVDAAISTDPSRRPARRDALPCRLVVDADTLSLFRRDGRPLLRVPLDRVQAQPLPGSRPTALVLGVDRSSLRVDFRLPRPIPPGPRGLLRRLVATAATGRAAVRRRRFLSAVR